MIVSSSFWCDVHHMMKAAKDEWHQLGNEIYTTYIKKQHAGIRLNKQILKVRHTLHDF